MKAVPISKTTVTRFANNFMERWLANIKMPSMVLTSNGSHFNSNLFAVLFKKLGIQVVKNYK